MTTNDKHCQTFQVREITLVANSNVLGMYDESVPVNAREIESPSSEGSAEVVKASAGSAANVKGAMSKFNPPVRHTARHDFDSESDSDSDGENFLENVSGEDQSPDRKSTDKDSRDGLKTKLNLHGADSSNSESDSADLELEPDRLVATGGAVAGAGAMASSRSGKGASGQGRGAGGGGVVIPAEGAYDPKQYQDLKVPAEMENLFQYIMKYTPQKIDIDFKLQPFVPDYVPAVGDIDAFIKVTTPTCNARAAPLAEITHEHIDNLGLMVLDEPSSEQSDSALLHLQLRAISKTSSAKSTLLTKKIENAEKNSKAIDRWIKDISELHLSKPAPTVNYTNKMPDIDTLMEEWPESMEETLNEVGFPPPTLDCTLAQYVDLVCAIFDIPVAGDTLNDRIQALHLLFSLYSAVKNSQLYVDRQKDSVT